MPKKENLKVRCATCSYTVEIPRGLVEEFIKKFCSTFTVKPVVDGAGAPKSVDGIVPGKDVFHVTVSVSDNQIGKFKEFVSKFADENGIGSNCRDCK